MTTPIKTVAIDCRFASFAAGLGRYVRSIVPALLQRDDAWTYVLIVSDESQPWLQELPSDRYSLLVTSCRHYSLKEQWMLPKLLRSHGVDLLFSPHFNTPFFPGVPAVVTIHDLILHRYAGHVSLARRLAYRILFSRSVRMATSIIAVSAFTARELATAYGKRVATKTTVIAETVDVSHFFPRSGEEQKTVRERYDLQDNFFLYVGNAKPHKNVQLLIDAFVKSGRTETLVLVTGGKEAAALRLPPRVRILSNVDDVDLPTLYSAATCFVTASLYEGFGFPILEAQCCGCPVIASSTSAIPEVADENAVLVEPTMEAFVSALQEFEAPSSYPLSPIPSWSDLASSTAQVLADALH